MLTTDYFPNEPIPPPMHGLDEAGLTGVIMQRLAQFLNTRTQCRITDYGIGPHGLKQILLGNYLPGMLH
jgi:hypothetical protein